MIARKSVRTGAGFKKKIMGVPNLFIPLEHAIYVIAIAIEVLNEYG